MNYVQLLKAPVSASSQLPTHMSMELSLSRPMSCRGRAAGLRLPQHLSAQLNGDIPEAMVQAVLDIKGFKQPEVVLFQAKDNSIRVTNLKLFNFYLQQYFNI